MLIRPWIRSALFPRRFGILCSQFDCVLPRMTTISPDERGILICGTLLVPFPPSAGDFDVAVDVAVVDD